MARQLTSSIRRLRPLAILFLLLVAPVSVAPAAISIDTPSYRLFVGGAKDAEALLRTKVEEAGGNFFVLHDLGTVLYRQGKVDAARRLWDEAAKKDSEVASADVEIIFQQIAQGRFDAARIALKRAKQRTPKNPHVFLAEAQFAVRHRDVDSASAAYQKALSLSPRSFTANLAYGQFLELTGDVSKSQELYKKAADIRPDNSVSWFLLGSSEFRRDNIDACLKYLIQAEKAQPEDPLAEARLAEMYLNAGDYVAAYQWYKKALARDSSDMLVKVRLGQMLSILKRNELARDMFQSVTAENEYVPALVALAQLDEADGRWSESAELYRRVLKQDSDNVIANNNLAMLHVQLGESAEDALNLVRKARQLQPNSPNIESTYGCVLAHAGQHKRAAEILRQSVRVEPTNAWVRYCYGLSLHGAGRSDDARQQFAACLLLEKDFPKKKQISELNSN